MSTFNYQTEQRIAANSNRIDNVLLNVGRLEGRLRAVENSMDQIIQMSEDAIRSVAELQVLMRDMRVLHDMLEVVRGEAE